MFEKIGRAAEQMASNVGVSRRGFLGRLGQSALAVGAVLGGFATPAAGQSSGTLCCRYLCFRRGYIYGSKTICKSAGSTCPASTSGNGGRCQFEGSFAVSDCASCK